MPSWQSLVTPPHPPLPQHLQRRLLPKHLQKVLPREHLITCPPADLTLMAATLP